MKIKLNQVFALLLSASAIMSFSAAQAENNEWFLGNYSARKIVRWDIFNGTTLSAPVGTLTLRKAASGQYILQTTFDLVHEGCNTQIEGLKSIRNLSSRVVLEFNYRTQCNNDVDTSAPLRLSLSPKRNWISLDTYGEAAYTRGMPLFKN